MCDTCVPDIIPDRLISPEAEKVLAAVLSGRVQQELGIILTVENLNQAVMDLPFQS